MFRPITYAPRGRISHSVAILSAALARGSPMCQRCSSRPRFPRGSSRLWSGPATKPSSEIDMWQVVSGTANLLDDCVSQVVVLTKSSAGRGSGSSAGEVRVHASAPSSHVQGAGSTDARAAIVIRHVKGPLHVRVH